MKAVFCSSSPIYIDRGGNYCSTTFTDDMFSRYFSVADSLTAIMRVRPFDGIADEDGIRKIKNSCIRFVPIPNFRTVKGLLLHFGEIKKVLRKEIDKADIAFIRLPGLVGYDAVDIAREMGKPYLVELCGCPWDSLWNYGVKGKIVAPFSMIATRRRVRVSPYVLYVTNSFLQHRYPTNGKWIACSNVMLQPVDEKTYQRREQHILEKSFNDKIRLGTAAGLDVPYKGQKYIIRALGQLKKEGADQFEYQLVGGGEGKGLLYEARKYGVENQIKVIGQLSHEEIFSWMDGLDLYCQPSKQEGLPRAMIEAMSRGVPCMGSDIAGIPELIPADYLFSHGSRSVNQICQILKCVAMSKEQQMKMARENFLKAKEYAREALEERRSKFYKEFVKSMGNLGDTTT